MKFVIRSIVFMHNNLANFMGLNSKRQVNFQIWVSNNHIKVAYNWKKTSIKSPIFRVVQPLTGPEWYQPNLRSVTQCFFWLLFVSDFFQELKFEISNFRDFDIMIMVSETKFQIAKTVCARRDPVLCNLLIVDQGIEWQKSWSRIKNYTKVSSSWQNLF